MEELLILGRIPFTGIQVSFTTWLIIVTLLAVIGIFTTLYRSKMTAIHAYFMHKLVLHMLVRRRLL